MASRRCLSLKPGTQVPGFFFPPSRSGSTACFRRFNRNNQPSSLPQPTSIARLLRPMRRSPRTLPIQRPITFLLRRRLPLRPLPRKFHLERPTILTVHPSLPHNPFLRHPLRQPTVRRQPLRSVLSRRGLSYFPRVRNTNTPFLFPIPISLSPSPFTSATATCVPTPESSSSKCGTNSAPPSPRFSSNQ